MQLRRFGASLLLAVVVLSIVAPGPAGAHSLESSTIAVTITDDSVGATISVVLETVDLALGTSYIDAEVGDFGDDLVASIDQHLSATSSDGTIWGETYAQPERESAEGIDSISVDVAFDTGVGNISQFTLTYDAIIEAIPDHEAVVVLTDSNIDISTDSNIDISTDSNIDISTVAVIDSSDIGLVITDGSHPVPVADMVRFGFDHVLAGADPFSFSPRCCCRPH